MTETGLKELFYLRLLPADELADQICSLPYTLVESIIETALKDEDMMFDLLTETIDILKKNMHLCISKKALRKVLKVCQVLGCVGYIDFGDWEAIRDEGNTVANVEPPEIIKNLIDAGQLEREPVNGRYRPYKSMPQFIQWCFDNGYEEDISKQFVWKNIYFRGDSIRSIEVYISKAKKVQ
ncbi:MAG: hypothetical protein LBK62_00990 [Treponema sp.]|jgi:hypothetical protein|nr:hypothetical protein [Treponema sp.]